MMNTSETTKEIWAAMFEFQQKVSPVIKTGLDKSKGYKYATYEDLRTAMNTALFIAGLSFIQYPGVSETPGTVVVYTRFTHKSGEFIEYCFSVNVSDGGFIKGIQAVGSAITYAYRYSLAGIIGVGCTEKDDDGAAASGGQSYGDNVRHSNSAKITQKTVKKEQTPEVVALLGELSVYRNRFQKAKAEEDELGMEDARVCGEEIKELLKGHGVIV